MTTVLTANSYFGLIPGLFPNTPHQFSYYSRTVNKIISCKPYSRRIRKTLEALLIMKLHMSKITRHVFGGAGMTQR